MSSRLPLLAVVLCGALVLLAAAQRCPAAEKPSAEQVIEKALASPTSMEFIETPLQDVVDFLKHKHKIEIQINSRALDDVGIGADTPVTKNLKGVSLRSALNLVLRDLDLTYLIQDEVLLITTQEEAQSRLTTKVYPVADLITRSDQGHGGNQGHGGDPADYDTMIEMITSTIAPASWDEVGGPGSIACGTFGNVETLVISQTYHVHCKIAALLDELRKVVADNQPGPEAATDKAASDQPAADLTTDPVAQPQVDPFGAPIGKPAPPPPAPSPDKKAADDSDDPFSG